MTGYMCECPRNFTGSNCQTSRWTIPVAHANPTSTGGMPSSQPTNSIPIAVTYGGSGAPGMYSGSAAQSLNAMATSSKAVFGSDILSPTDQLFDATNRECVGVAISCQSD